MELLESIKKVPLLRPAAVPHTPGLAVVCYADALSQLSKFVLRKAKAIFIVDHMEELPTKLLNESDNSTIPISPLSALSDCLSLDIAFFNHVYDYARLAIGPLWLKTIGFESFYNLMPIPYNKGITTTHIPNYFSSNRADLEYVYNLLVDDESKEIFASRIRAIETGNVGYIKISNFSEYFHPLVQPVPGDVILDGGVSDCIGPQVTFSTTVGEHGAIYGFEPDPIGFCSAREKLLTRCPHKNYTLVPLGLWNKKDFLLFEIDGQGTHINSETTEKSAQCEVISIDEFCRDYHIQHIDFIKLDVEGAEGNTLKGAIHSIVKHKPKLAISLYHTPQDLFFLPKLIHEIYPGYAFYLGHHHGSLHETILYCTPQEASAHKA